MSNPFRYFKTSPEIIRFAKKVAGLVHSSSQKGTAGGFRDHAGLYRQYPGSGYTSEMSAPSAAAATSSRS